MGDVFPRFVSKEASTAGDMFGRGGGFERAQLESSFTRREAGISAACLPTVRKRATFTPALHRGDVNYHCC